MTKKKKTTVDVVVTLPVQVHLALKLLSKSEGVPMAGMIRHALIEWMQRQGINVKDDIVWGGSRYTPTNRERTDDEPGQFEAVEAF